MTVLYETSATKTNLEVVPQLKLVIENLKDLERRPLSALTTRTNVFDQPLKEDDPVISKVILRQLQPYLSRDLSEPSAEMLTQTESTPIHNILQ